MYPKKNHDSKMYTEESVENIFNQIYIKKKNRYKPITPRNPFNE